MTTQKQISLSIYSFATLLLILPSIAMPFTNEVNWTASDFLIGGALLFLTAFAVDLILKRLKSLKSRLILVFGILTLLFLIWVELAVGIFGSPFAGS